MPAAATAAANITKAIPRRSRLGKGKVCSWPVFGQTLRATAFRGTLRLLPSRLTREGLYAFRKRHPRKASLHPYLPFRCAQFMPLFERPDSQRISCRLFDCACIQRGAAVFAKCENPLCTTGSGLDIDARSALHQTEAGRGCGDVGAKGGTRMSLTVSAVTDCHASLLNFSFVCNRAAMALAVNFHVSSPNGTAPD